MSRKKNSEATVNGGADESRPMVGSEFASAGHARNGKPAETKAQRFRRLAEDRVQKALDRIMRLEPLGNRAQYEWGPEEADAIVGALSLAVGRVKLALDKGAPEKPTFRFHPPSAGAAQPQAEASAAQ